MRRRWTKEEAWKWYSSRPWVMGINYVPSITLHCAELWQEDTHDEVMKSVKKEFSLMKDIGLNSVRMFMPFSIWYYDREKFLLRLDKFLTALDKHGISMMPVILMIAWGLENQRIFDLNDPRAGIVMISDIMAAIKITPLQVKGNGRGGFIGTKRSGDRLW